MKPAVLRDLPPLPASMRKLPVHRGYPVPWFVAWFDGVPDFRVVDEKRHAQAVAGKRCLVCGGKIHGEFAFPIGPMCAVNRTSAEAPSHVDCAVFSAKACPFLSRPNMVRRMNDLPEGHVAPAGVMIERNPGVSLIWVTDTYRIFRHGDSGLFELGRPKRVLAFREGRPATAAEIQESVASGFPRLLEVAAKEDAVEELLAHLDRASVALRLDSGELRAACAAQAGMSGAVA